MTVRDQISTQISRVGRLFLGGILLIGLLIPIEVLSEKLFGVGAVISAVSFATALALLVAAFIILASSGRLIRCPCCGGNWFFALHGPYVRFFSLHPRYRFCPYCGVSLDSECLEETDPDHHEKPTAQESGELVIRDELSKRLRRINVILLGGFGICGLAVLSQTLEWPKPITDAIFYSGFAAAVIALMYGYRTGLKCPCCGGNWSFVLRGGYYRFFSVHLAYQFCPYCGVPLDSRCPDEGATEKDRL